MELDTLTYSFFFLFVNRDHLLLYYLLKICCKCFVITEQPKVVKKEDATEEKRGVAIGCVHIYHLIMGGMVYQVEGGEMIV
jgi:hypothetical protein